MNGKNYIRLLSYMQSMGSSYVFMDDNAPCQQSQAVIRWLQSKGLKQMEVWPPQSPDLNPIKHVWDILEAKLECYKPKNSRELEERIKEETGLHLGFCSRGGKISRGGGGQTSSKGGGGGGGE